jgi:hypothetical protein
MKRRHREFGVCCQGYAHQQQHISRMISKLTRSGNILLNRRFLNLESDYKKRRLIDLLSVSVDLHATKNIDINIFQDSHATA